MTQHPTRPLQKIEPKPAATTIDQQSEVDSKQLFTDAKELFICHGGERYTLRRTSKGKLILTK